jgi:hypothetical protein
VRLVPRYFFNFDNGVSGLADLVGRDLPDDEAAKSHAVRLAADLSADSAIEGELPTFQWIEVVDEAQRPVARLPVSDTLKEPNRRS